MKNVVINNLSNDYLMNNLQEFLIIDKEIKQDHWTADNFLYELPKKWQLSLIATYNQLLIGFIIASRKENSIHIHRLVIRSVFQSQGIGAMMIERLSGEAKRQSIALTLKVHSSNSKAIKFYQRLNFKITGESGNNLLMKKY